MGPLSCSRFQSPRTEPEGLESNPFRNALNVASSRAEQGSGPIAYVLARSYWGQGLMTEALAWLVDWALKQPAIRRAWAMCDVDNPNSARVMEKAGMQREGIRRGG